MIPPFDASYFNNVNITFHQPRQPWNLWTIPMAKKIRHGQESVGPRFTPSDVASTWKFSRPKQAQKSIIKKKARLVPWVFIIFYNYRCLSNQQVYWLVASIVTLQVGRNTILNVKVSKKHSSQSHRNVTEGTTNGSEVPSVLSHWKLGKITMVIKQLLQTKTCLYYLYITYESHDCGWFQWTPRQPIEDVWGPHGN
jgi:hypothetical protein